MNTNQKAIVAGLALGSFMGMLLILFSLITVPTLAAVTLPLAAAGVFLGAFAACLVMTTWVTGEAVTNRFMVLEVA